jgi:hypothetical protein
MQSTETKGKSREVRMHWPDSSTQRNFQPYAQQGQRRWSIQPCAAAHLGVIP